MSAYSLSLRYFRSGYQLRRTPELFFHLDDSLDYIENIDNLLAADKKAEDKTQPEDGEKA